MKILVTGGAGFLGSVVVPYLLNQNHSVTVVDSLRYGQVSLLDCCIDPNFNFVQGDVRDEALMKSLILSADCIIPLAAIVGAPACNRDKHAAITVNRDAIALIIKHRSKQQAIIMPMTNSGYGIGASGVECTEDSPLRPVSLYGTSKVEAEQMLLDSGEAITFRLATVFGVSPRMRLDLLVNDFVYRAVNDRAVVLFEPHFKRNYIHIRDIARVFQYGIDHFHVMKNKPYNVGLSDANLSKLELCNRIQKHLPKFVFYESGIGEDPDKRDYIVSNKRIEAAGWHPQYSLDDGIRELIVAYRIVQRNSFTNL